ncbi:MAG: leucyl aminopeptidase family protein [Rhodospirillaceae bacterium]|nr:leucyl aminopeptidase family protein [Rhodospirillaceae bacterium]
MVSLPFVDPTVDAAIPLVAVTAGAAADWLAAQPEARRQWLAGAGFRGEAGQSATWPGADGGIGGCVVAGGDPAAAAFAGLPLTLPAGTYRLEGAAPGLATTAALAWAQGAYQFTRYKTASRAPALLEMPPGVDAGRVRTIAEALWLGRDLINTPANDMGPADLAAAAEEVAGRFGATIALTVGEALLEANYPLIHAVGRASASPPRLIDLTWGDPAARKLTLVGKGVCFDTGGLDLKPASGMLMMKKDMGGAAHALALAQMVMALGLPVRLRVLIPAVENAVSGSAFRPLDVLASRKGLTVEVGNTDAEGRLVLADALALAMEDGPELVIDYATLTGAARVALGPDLPALFTRHDDLAAAFAAAGEGAGDPTWRLPLWQPYAKLLQSRVADINNTGEGGLAGAITAALFLDRFVEPAVPWVHLDVYGWSPSDRPGRPRGACMMGVEAALAVIEQRLVASAP